MGMNLGPATFPEPLEWNLRSTRTKEIRTFEQMELSIEAESKLIGLVYRTAVALTAADFPWDKLASLFEPTPPKPPQVEGALIVPSEPEVGAVNWPLAIEMLNMVRLQTPDAVVDSTLLFFGIHAQNADGTPNQTYDTDRRFLQDAVTFTGWVELIKAFAKQNDYGRLIAPFGQALGSGAPGIGRALDQMRQTGGSQRP
jgi:hypothetical protein